MPDTFTLIASSTVGAGGSQVIDFTSIPSTYTDLLLRISLRTNFTSSAFADCFLIINGGTTSSIRTIVGTGSSTSSGNSSGNSYMEAGKSSAAPGAANTFSNTDIYIPNYAGSNNKSVSTDAVQENGTTEALMYMIGGLASTTSAITRLTISGGTSTSGLSTNAFVQHSSAYLYGIKKD